MYDAMTAGRQVMLKANWMLLLIIGTLLPAAGLADDAKSSRSTGKTPPLSALSLDLLSARSPYAPRWQLAHPVETIAWSDDWSRTMPDFDFQDSGILGRVSKLRGLSFLTLAEHGKARLFLGVNKEGLVGLHFHAHSRHGSARYLEVARMPYLKNSRPGTETE